MTDHLTSKTHVVESDAAYLENMARTGGFSISTQNELRDLADRIRLAAEPPAADLVQMLDDLVDAARGSSDAVLQAKRQNILNYATTVRLAQPPTADLIPGSPLDDYIGAIAERRSALPPVDVLAPFVDLAGKWQRNEIGSVSACAELTRLVSNAVTKSEQSNTEGEAGVAARVGPGGGAIARCGGETHAPELSDEKEPSLPDEREDPCHPDFVAPLDETKSAARTKSPYQTILCDHDPTSHGSTLECDERGALKCKHCTALDGATSETSACDCDEPKDGAHSFDCPAVETSERQL